MNTLHLFLLLAACATVAMCLPILKPMKSTDFFYNYEEIHEPTPATTVAPSEEMTCSTTEAQKSGTTETAELPIELDSSLVAMHVLPQTTWFDVNHIFYSSVNLTVFVF